MWIFTRYGFYSIACARTPNGAPDLENVMIRARLRDHLCGLQERFPDLASTEITTTPERDYRYRLTGSKRVWASILYELSLEQEWSNLKNEAEAYQGKRGTEYVHALHQVWSVMHLAREPVHFQSFVCLHVEVEIALPKVVEQDRDDIHIMKRTGIDPCSTIGFTAPMRSRL